MPDPLDDLIKKHGGTVSVDDLIAKHGGTVEDEMPPALPEDEPPAGFFSRAIESGKGLLSGVADLAGSAFNMPGPRERVLRGLMHTAQEATGTGSDPEAHPVKAVLRLAGMNPENLSKDWDESNYPALAGDVVLPAALVAAPHVPYAAVARGSARGAGMAMEGLGNSYVGPGMAAYGFARGNPYEIGAGLAITAAKPVLKMGGQWLRDLGTPGPPSTVARGATSSQMPTRLIGGSPTGLSLEVPDASPMSSTGIQRPMIGGSPSTLSATVPDAIPSPTSGMTPAQAAMVAKLPPDAQAAILEQLQGGTSPARPVAQKPTGPFNQENAVRLGLIKPVASTTGPVTFQASANPSDLVPASAAPAAPPTTPQAVLKVVQDKVPTSQIASKSKAARGMGDLSPNDVQYLQERYKITLPPGASITKLAPDIAADLLKYRASRAELYRAGVNTGKEYEQEASGTRADQAIRPQGDWFREQAP